MVGRNVVKRSTALWLCLALITMLFGILGQFGSDTTEAAGSSYTLDDHWLHVSPGEHVGTVTSVDFDAKGVMYLFRRCDPDCLHPKEGDPPSRIWAFDSKGTFLREVGQKIAKEGHSLRVDRSGFIWTTDVQGHQVKKFRADGTLLMTLGSGIPGDGLDTFNMPTDVVVAPNGDVFVTDGYKNQRVMKFNKDGKFIKTWGTKGTEPGQFRVPHGIVQDSRGRIIVADRCGSTTAGNAGCTDNKIQVFDTDGKFLDQWPHLRAVSLYITKDDKLYVSGDGKISIADARTGKVLDTIEKAGGHGIAVDPAGNVYTAGNQAGLKRYAR